jgi:hypothetical protein
MIIAVLYKLAQNKSFGRDPLQQPAILNQQNVFF